MGGTKYYFYDAAGNLETVSDNVDPASGAVVTTTSFDLRGLKTTMDDPDLGLWEYKYNGFGELVYQKDAKGQVATMQYDKLGRMKARSEPEGITTWSYDNAAHGVGKLSSVTNSANGHTRMYTYDVLSRLESETSSIDSKILSMSYTYNAESRMETVTYPTGFIVRNIYAPGGQLKEVKNAINDSSYWIAEEEDPFGNVTWETLGNGLETIRTYTAHSGALKVLTTGTGTGSGVQYLDYGFDELGNLKYRRDNNQSLYESFTYDDLNRLKVAKISYQGIITGSRTYDYDLQGLGNLKQKSDYGDDYTYGGVTAGPHAVTEVKNGGVTQAAYTYDANGNMLCEITGTICDSASRNITWTSFNKPSQISKGATSITFAYDGDHNRVRQVNNTHTVYYFNPRLDSGHHYEQEDDGSIIEHKHFIYAGSRPVAIYTKRSDSTEKTRYLHTDHLGSIDVVTDEAGAVVERMSFSPFGSRRNADWTDPTSVLAGIETHHGFTGHEQLDDVGLIHMNGRLYDPKLGRFLSPDIQVQYPDNTQSFNRYSYVHNNPLSYVDPSGYGFLSDLWKGFKSIIRPVLAIAAAIYLPFGPFINGFISGLILSGGDLRTAFVFAVTSVAFSQLKVLADAGKIAGFAKTFAYGAVGGLQSRLQGGKFISGFLSAGFTTSISGTIQGIRSSIGRVVASAVAGGAASVVGGGKFANGAVTGSFSYIFASDASSRSGIGRALTADEIDLAKEGFARAFGSDASFDYSAVRVINGKYVMFQGNGYVMAPDGNIYWPGECGNLATCGGPTGSISQLDTAGTFLHEMSHVWDYQHGINVLLEGFITQAAHFLTFGIYNPYIVPAGVPYGQMNIESRAEYLRMQVFP